METRGAARVSCSYAAMHRASNPLTTSGEELQRDQRGRCRLRQDGDRHRLALPSRRGQSTHPGEKPTTNIGEKPTTYGASSWFR